MSTKAGVPLERTPISDWLEELHMECYKKNLEDYETIKVSAEKLCVHTAYILCMYVCKTYSNTNRSSRALVSAWATYLIKVEWWTLSHA